MTKHCIKLIQHIALLLHQQSTKINELEAVISNLPGSVYWKDEDGVYLGRNPYAQQKMKEAGLDWQQCEGLTDYDLFDEATATRFRENDLTVINSKTEIASEETHFTADGKITVNYSVKRPLIINNTVKGLLGVSLDITNLKQIEHELQQAKKQEQQADLMKKNFMLNIEHDMRTPASTIAALSKNRLNKTQDKSTRSDLQDILLCSENIMMYIEKILEFNQLTQGSLTLKKTPCSIEQCVKSVLASQRSIIQNKNLTLTHAIATNLPKHVNTDYYLIFSIFSNLISNAVKFTDSGSVNVFIDYESNNSLSGNIIFSVSDSGIGIAENDLPFIHDTFFRAEASNTEKYKGRGIGLSIVKSATDILQATLSVKSEKNVGSTFTCKIPVEVNLGAQDKKDQPPNNATWKKNITNILVIDDNPLCQKIAMEALIEENFTVHIASDGQEALALTNQQAFDLILVDIGLPDIDGFTLSNSIQHQSTHNQGTILIALTAHNPKSLHEELAGSSLHDLLTKPLSITDLANTLLKI